LIAISLEYLIFGVDDFDIARLLQVLLLVEAFQEALPSGASIAPPLASIHQRHLRIQVALSIDVFQLLGLILQIVDDPFIIAISSFSLFTLLFHYFSLCAFQDGAQLLPELVHPLSVNGIAAVIAIG